MSSPIDSGKEYIRIELDYLHDQGTLRQIISLIHQAKGIRYGQLRTARLREQSRQLRLFAEHPRRGF